MTEFLLYWKYYWEDIAHDPNSVNDKWHTSSKPFSDKVKQGDILWIVITGGPDHPNEWRLLQKIVVRTKFLSRSNDRPYGIQGDPTKGQKYDIEQQTDAAKLLRQFEFASSKKKSADGKRMGRAIQADGRRIGNVLQAFRTLSASDAKLIAQHARNHVHPSSVARGQSSDSSALTQIENLSVDEYKVALEMLRGQMAESDLRMLRANYEAANHEISATELALRVGFPMFETANLRYGRLAAKFLNFFQIRLKKYAKLNALVFFDRPDDEWHWTLRPQVAQALEELGWFDSASGISVIQELEQLKPTYESLPETTRQAVIQSRIGQGQFRSSLIEYWRACAVTGCEQLEVLRASHTKPWRDSSNSERLDPSNGLLLLPNLDACFDLGLISFQDNGTILISSKLTRSTLSELGITKTMKLRRVQERQKDFLRYHREGRFQP